MREYVVYPNILWCVENLSLDSKKIGPVIQFLQCAWKLKIIIYTCVGGDKIQIFLKRGVDPKYTLDMYFNIFTCVCDEDGTRYLEKSLKVPTTATKICIWEASVFEMLKLNANFEHSSNFLLSFVPGKGWRQHEEQYEDSECDFGAVGGLSVLCKDFEKLLDNDAHADLVLICEGIKFPVHKAILSARSAVFREKFQNCEEVDQKQQVTVNITDMGVDVLGHILRFIYLGELPVDSLPLAQSIFDAVRMYKIGSWSIAG